jgi:hypothetical protein
LKRVNKIVVLTVFLYPGKMLFLLFIWVYRHKAPGAREKKRSLHKYINKLLLEVHGDLNRQPRMATLFCIGQVLAAADGRPTFIAAGCRCHPSLYFHLKRGGNN